MSSNCLHFITAAYFSLTWHSFVYWFSGNSIHRKEIKPHSIILRYSEILYLHERFFYLQSCFVHVYFCHHFTFKCVDTRHWKKMASGSLLCWRKVMKWKLSLHVQLQCTASQYKTLIPHISLWVSRNNKMLSSVIFAFGPQSCAPFISYDECC